MRSAAFKRHPTPGATPAPSDPQAEAGCPSGGRRPCSFSAEAVRRTRAASGDANRLPAPPGGGPVGSGTMRLAREHGPAPQTTGVATQEEAGERRGATRRRGHRARRRRRQGRCHHWARCTPHASLVGALSWLGRERRGRQGWCSRDTRGRFCPDRRQGPYPQLRPIRAAPPLQGSRPPSTRWTAPAPATSLPRRGSVATVRGPADCFKGLVGAPIHST